MTVHQFFVFYIEMLSPVECRNFVLVDTEYRGFPENQLVLKINEPVYDKRGLMTRRHFSEKGIL